MAQTTETTTFLDMTKERWSVRKFAPEQISDEHYRELTRHTLPRSGPASIAAT